MSNIWNSILEPGENIIVEARPKRDSTASRQENTERSLTILIGVATGALSYLLYVKWFTWLASSSFMIVLMTMAVLPIVSFINLLQGLTPRKWKYDLLHSETYYLVTNNRSIIAKRKKQVPGGHPTYAHILHEWRHKWLDRPQKTANAILFEYKESFVRHHFWFKAPPDKAYNLGFVMLDEANKLFDAIMAQINPTKKKYA